MRGWGKATAREHRLLAPGRAWTAAGRRRYASGRSRAERRSVSPAAMGADALVVCREQRAQRQPVIDRSVHTRFDRGNRGAPVSCRTRRWSWEECVIFSSSLSMVRVLGRIAGGPAKPPELSARLRWAAASVLGLIRDRLRRRLRLAADKTPQTTSVFVDSQSVKVSETASRATRGWDGVNQIKWEEAAQCRNVAPFQGRHDPLLVRHGGRSEPKSSRPEAYQWLLKGWAAKHPARGVPAFAPARRSSPGPNRFRSRSPARPHPRRRRPRSRRPPFRRRRSLRPPSDIAPSGRAEGRQAREAPDPPSAAHNCPAEDTSSSNGPSSPPRSPHWPTRPSAPQHAVGRLTMWRERCGSD